MPTAVEDKDAIRELMAEYCYRSTTDDMTRWQPCSPKMAPGIPPLARRRACAAIAELARAFGRRPDRRRPRAVHLVTNIVIALDGARAQVRSNWMVMQNSPPGPKIGSGGAYVDEIVNRTGLAFRYRKIDSFIAA